MEISAKDYRPRVERPAKQRKDEKSTDKPHSLQRKKDQQKKTKEESTLFFLTRPVQLTEEQKETLLPLFVDAENADAYDLDHWQSQLEKLMEGTLRIIDRCQEDGIETVFFLDKSARPLATLMRKTWKKLLPDQPIPQTRFIDIGRTQEAEAHPNTIKTPQKITRREAKKLRERYSQIDPSGKILVIDEFSWSGNTIEQAKMTLEQLYPKAQIRGELALDYPHPWYGKPELLDVTDPPEENNVASYFAKPNTSYRQERLKFRQQLELIAAIIAENREELPVGAKRVEKVYYPRKPWD